MEGDVQSNCQDSTEYLPGPKRWAHKLIMHATYLAVTTSWTEYRNDCHSVEVPNMILALLHFRIQVAAGMLKVHCKLPYMKETQIYFSCDVYVFIRSQKTSLIFKTAMGVHIPIHYSLSSSHSTLLSELPELTVSLNKVQINNK